MDEGQFKEEGGGDVYYGETAFRSSSSPCLFHLFYPWSFSSSYFPQVPSLCCCSPRYRGDTEFQSKAFPDAGDWENKMGGEEGKEEQEKEVQKGEGEKPFTRW